MFKKRGFTLVEIMIVVAIIGIIIAIAIPSFLRAREVSRSRSCQENLSKVDGAKEQYALDQNLGDGQAVPGGMATLVGNTNYIKVTPTCAAGGTYTLNNVGIDPACTYTPPTWAPDHAMPGAGS